MSDVQRAMIDLNVYGKRAKAARILAGCETVKDGADLVRRLTGIRLSDRTLYALERGMQMPTVEHYFALTVAYEPPGGLRYWEPALGDAVTEYIAHRIRSGSD